MVEYLGILIFIIVGLMLASIMAVASFVVNKRRYDEEKMSPYECGFPTFSDARDKFNVHFSIVGILFIVFDLEVAFLFPWAAGLQEAGQFGFWSVLVFLTILTVGFIYEWKKGALDWS